MPRCNGRDCQIELLTIFGSFIIQSWVSPGHSLAGGGRRGGRGLCHHAPRLLAGGQYAGSSPRAYLLKRRRRRRRRRGDVHQKQQLTTVSNRPAGTPLPLSGSESALLVAGQERFLNLRISHLPCGPVSPPTRAARTKTPLAVSPVSPVSHNEESLLHSE